MSGEPVNPNLQHFAEGLFLILVYFPECTLFVLTLQQYCPWVYLQGKNKVVHDCMTEQKFALSLKRGIFPLETKAKNRTIAIFLFFIIPSLILQGQEADINNKYILKQILASLPISFSINKYLLLYTIHPQAYLPHYIM